MTAARRNGWGSRTGRPGSSPRSWGSRSRPWPGSGGNGRSSRTGWRRSSSAPTRNWKPGSATSSACTWPRRITRWWSALTRSPRCRPWTALRRCCRCGPGLAARRTHDYKRHGTTTLFAALDIATGKITADACYPRHRHQEFLRFLKKAAAAHPAVDLHVVLDNYGTHKHPEVRKWLAKPENQRITLHFTPTSCSWLNMVEIFFGIITRQAIRRGTFASVKDLTTAIGTFIDAYNERCEPFAWTKDADQLLPKIRPSKN